MCKIPSKCATLDIIEISEENGEHVDIDDDQLLMPSVRFEYNYISTHSKRLFQFFEYAQIKTPQSFSFPYCFGYKGSLSIIHESESAKEVIYFLRTSPIFSIISGLRVNMRTFDARISVTQHSHCCYDTLNSRYFTKRKKIKICLNFLTKINVKNVFPDRKYRRNLQKKIYGMFEMFECLIFDRMPQKTAFLLKVLLFD
ncbi:hypothetical protein BpHYR1_006859 [Brachionus plicatilis]|uniref:Uncharacterized protein n=1 Tax=Brachionus plicatilis TaxID=10195 RepID=A0A3M7P9A2_BRAPC|nr:hypothetical protein BpHYR1_006859 [Brachionus plicatilis]